MAFGIGFLDHSRRCFGIEVALEFKRDKGKADMEEESSSQTADATFKVWLDTSIRCFSFKLSYKPFLCLVFVFCFLVNL